MRKNFVHFIGVFVLIVSIAGCAGLQRPPAVAPSPPGAEARLVAAGKSLKAVKRQIAAFYAELATVEGKIEEQLRSRPCWSGFERILLQYPTLTDPGKDAEMPPEIRSRLSQWSREYKVPWKAFRHVYFQLADSCAILDMKRVAARQMLISVQASYMAVVMMEAAAGNEKKAHKIFLLVNSLDKPGARLESIRLDRLGLYGAAPAGAKKKLRDSSAN